MDRRQEVIREEIIKNCFGCNNISHTNTCVVYVFPGAKWSYGNCPMATHVKKEEKKTTKQIDPIKASKRKAKGT